MDGTYGPVAYVDFAKLHMVATVVQLLAELRELRGSASPSIPLLVLCHHCQTPSGTDSAQSSSRRFDGCVEFKGLHPWAVFITPALGMVTWLAVAIYFKLPKRKGQANCDVWSGSCTNRSLGNGKMSSEAMCVKAVRCPHPAIGA